MGTQEVVDYVMETPHNPNEMVLRTLLNDMSGGSSNLPSVTTNDNGKVLTVVEGQWDKANIVDNSLKNIKDEANGGIKEGCIKLPEDAPAYLVLNQAIGTNAHVEGGLLEQKYDEEEDETEWINNSNKATGSCSHAEGQKTSASGNDSHAEGYDTSAVGSHSHAEGYKTKALQAGAHAEGGMTTASGVYAHAEGSASTANGLHAHAEGLRTTATGDGSHAEGQNTIATHKSQHVFGEFNITDSSEAPANEKGTYVEIVGNGSLNNQSNARTLDWNGNEWLAGTLTLGNTTITEAQLQALLALLD